MAHISSAQSSRALMPLEGRALPYPDSLPLFCFSPPPPLLFKGRQRRAALEEGIYFSTDPFQGEFKPSPEHVLLLKLQRNFTDIKSTMISSSHLMHNTACRIPPQDSPLKPSALQLADILGLPVIIQHHLQPWLRGSLVQSLLLQQ